MYYRYILACFGNMHLPTPSFPRKDRDIADKLPQMLLAPNKVAANAIPSVLLSRK